MGRKAGGVIAESDGARLDGEVDVLGRQDETGPRRRDVRTERGGRVQLCVGGPHEEAVGEVGCGVHDVPVQYIYISPVNLFFVENDCGFFSDIALLTGQTNVGVRVCVLIIIKTRT